jgi:hypothetical protein
VQEFGQLGICWLRFQMSASMIERGPGTYDWSALDQAVAAMNAAGIHIDFPIRCFGPGACFKNPSLPTASHLSQFATALATRYNGKSGHGRIDAFEIGNEEYDFFPPSAYGPFLKVGYLAIKSVSPDAFVGMYGTYRPSLSHIQAVMSAIASGYSQYLDFANFHFYEHGGDPRVTTADHPSFNSVWQAIHAILPDKPIWCTEVGWPTSSLPGIRAVSPQEQAANLRYVMEQAAASQAIRKVFWFTLDYGSQPDSISPNGSPLPAFYTYQDVVKQLVW